MEDLGFEGTACHEITDSRRGAVARNLTPVLVGEHRFDRNHPHCDQLLDQHLHSVLVQAKVPNSFTSAPLKVLFNLCDNEYCLSYFLETEERKDFSHSEIQGLLLPNAEAAWVKSVADAYNLEEEYFFNNGVKFYRGVCRASGEMPVIVKMHKFKNVDKASTQKSISQCLTAALTQAQHPHCCTLLDIHIRFKKKCCRIYHVLEKMPSDVKQDIEQRKKENKPYTEEELWDFLRQTSESLSYSHSRKIAHLDLRPLFFCRNEESYKVLDLGFHLREQQNGKAHIYQCPEIRERQVEPDMQVCEEKADVFALGAIVLEMATLQTPPSKDENVTVAVSGLPHSARFKGLLQSMLAFKEGSRPSFCDIQRMFSVFEQDDRYLRGLEELKEEVETCAPQPLVVFESGKAIICADDLSSFDLKHQIYPIIVEGCMGKSSLLDSLSRRPGSFLSKKDSPDGVYMSPQPVSSRGFSLLLLKLRNPVKNEEAYLQLRRKARALFMALSCAWCICEDNRDATFKTIENFLLDYAKVQERYSVKMSKIFIFVKKNWFERESQQNQLNTVLSKHPNLFTLMYRGDENSEEEQLAAFASELTAEALNEPFSSTHQEMYQGNFPSRFITLVKAAAEIASLDISCETFLIKMPDMNVADSDIDAHVLSMKEIASTSEKAKSAEALKFLVQYKEEFTNVFDTSILEKLQTTFKLKEPTIVLAIMGPPGCGKSTLLNFIVQHCADAPQPISIFKTGNTVGHTTIGSHVLPHPLSLNKQQLMLIDLEGLGGTEIADCLKALRQDNLVKAIMKISSVLAIIVTNEYQKQEQVKSYINLFAQVNQGCVERVFLLFHDKQKTAGENAAFKRDVQRMNATIFRGKEVVKILNKPSFVADAEERREFLKTFLSDCHYEKKSFSDNFVSIQDLLTTLSVTAQQESENMELTPAESEELKAFQQTKCKELANLAETIISDKDNLADIFVEKYNTEFISAILRELRLKRPCMIQHCITRLDLEMRKLKIELESLDSCYSAMRMSTEKDILQLVSALIQYRHDLAYCIIDFRTSVTELKSKLVQFKTHFPNDRRLDNLIAHFDREKEEKEKKSYRNYVLQIGATVATSGVAALAVRLKLIKVVSLGAKVLAIGGMGAATLASTMGYGLCASLIILHKAQELYFVNPLWGNDQLNPKALETLPKDPDSHAVVLLCIGSEKTSFANFANSFVRHIAPFTPVEFNAFDTGKLTQILSFNLAHPSVQNSISLAFIICLKMESRRDTEMLKIAEALLPAASLTCIFNDEQTYVELLIKSLAAKPASSRRKVIFWHTKEQNIEQLRPRISEVAEVQSLPSFSNEDFSSCMVEFKCAFNSVEVSHSSRLLERLQVINPAITLLNVNTFFYKKAITTDMQSLSSRTSTPSAPVLLFIGTKMTRLADFANNFVRYFVPLTNCQPFSENTYTQVLPFKYVHPKGPPNSFSDSYFICLRMKKKLKSNYAQNMLNIARNLLPAASLTCVFSTEANEYVKPLLESLRGPVPPEAPPERNLLVWHSHQPSLAELETIVADVPMQKQLLAIENFEKERIESISKSIKQEFDTAGVGTLSFFQNQVTASSTHFFDGQ